MLRDLHTAIALRGKALSLYLAIHHRSTLMGGRWITLPTKYLADWGIKKDAKSRDLRALQVAGLIEMRPLQLGQSARVLLVAGEL